MDLTDLPLLSYVTLALLAGLVGEAVLNLRMSWSRPAVAQYLTIAAWYLGDIFYNGPDVFYAQFTSNTINLAFVQLLLFLLAYRGFLLLGVGFFAEDRRPMLLPTLKDQERGVLRVVGLVWVVLYALAFYLAGFDFWSVVFPPLAGDPISPWAREGAGVGVGADFVISFLEYTYAAVCGLLGVMAVLARRPRVRALAWVLFAVAIQMYLFQRARNRVLSVLMPAVLAYLLMSSASVWRKAVVSAVLLVAISTLFLFILNTRDRQGRFADRFEEASREGESLDNVDKHLGINMLEELCHNNALMASGVYSPTPGESYFTQAVAIVPRTLWPDKPMISVEYSIARGFGAGGGGGGGAGGMGVHSAISSGIVGQGVQNFGPWVGPAFAAFLCAVLNGVLARLWVQRGDYLRLGLFFVGMGLMYNLGRDITLQVLFPFVFCYMGVKAYEVSTGKPPPRPSPFELRQG